MLSKPLFDRMIHVFGDSASGDHALGWHGIPSRGHASAGVCFVLLSFPPRAISYMSWDASLALQKSLTCLSQRGTNEQE